MVNLNLLPWRELEYRRHAKLFKSSALTFSIVILLSWIMLRSILLHQIQLLRQSNAALMQGLNTTQKNTNVDDLSFKVAESYALMNRNFLQIIHSSMPVDVCFDSMRLKDQAITFIGQAYSSQTFSDFLKTWSANNLFSQIDFNMMNADQNHAMHFEFKAVLAQSQLRESK